MKTLNVILFLFFVHPNLCGWFSDDSYQRVLLTDISALTFYKGEYTKARRSQAIPQLQCVGGTARCRGEPDVVQCRNVGSNGADVQWECKAELGTDYKLGRVDVNCEGFSSKNDPYVLKDSCGLSYNLDFTENHGKQQTQQQYNAREYPGRVNGGHFGQFAAQHMPRFGSWFGHHEAQPQPQHQQAHGNGMLYVLIMIVIFAALFCFGHNSRQGQQARGWFGNAFNQPGSGYAAPQPQRSAWTPGFWSGLFGGGALYHLFGGRQQRQPAYTTNYTRNWWGGQPHPSAPSAPYADSPHRRPASPQQTTHTSTGFGGSSRR